MNLSEIRLLQQFRQYPSITLMLPVNSEPGGVRSSRIRLESMMHDVRRRLEQNVSASDLILVLKNLRTVIDTLELKDKNARGLAILINRHMAKKIFLPRTVKERLTISESFSYRELVNSCSRAPVFRVLLLAPTEIRLLIGHNDYLRDANLNQFPMIHPSRVHASFEQAHIQTFFGQADSHLDSLRENETAPIILVGAARDVATYQAITSTPREKIAGTLSSSPGSSELWLSQLHTRCLHMMREYEHRQIAGTLKDLERAVAEDNYATGIHEVWRRAGSGRCETLIIEKNYFCPARVENGRLRIEQAHSGDEFGPALLPDAIDDVIEKVVSSGGNVCFVNEGDLARYGHVAAVLSAGANRELSRGASSEPDREQTGQQSRTQSITPPPVEIALPLREKVTTGHN